ncbi:MAG: hypothetical protein WBA28_08245 [Microbacteriaceae bacterium]
MSHRFAVSSHGTKTSRIALAIIATAALALMPALLNSGIAHAATIQVTTVNPT